MVVVAAMRPCNAAGTVVINYGPEATVEDSEVLIALASRLTPMRE